MRLFQLAACFFLCLSFSSCGEDQIEVDQQLILDYISDNNLDAIAGPDGLYYTIDEEGTGPSPNIASQVVVHYEGFLLDGSKFDSSIDRGQSLRIDLIQVIRGWQIGIPLFKTGGKGKLLIPSGLGYGEQSLQGIPANSVLVFDIELISFI